MPKCRGHLLGQPLRDGPLHQPISMNRLDIGLKEHGRLSTTFSITAASGVRGGEPEGLGNWVDGGVEGGRLRCSVY
jgi:hypothetical protein